MVAKHPTKPGTSSVARAVLALVCLSLTATNAVLAQSDEVPQIKIPLPPEAKIGRIYFTCNEFTIDRVILKAIGLKPGQPLREADLRAAEQKLMKLGIFDTHPDRAPSIKVLDRPDSDGAKDILVTITETYTGSWSLKPAITSNGLSFCLTLQEPNFDLLRIPTSLADIWDGRAFRGAGQKMHMSLIEIPLFPCSLPRIAAADWLNRLRMVHEACATEEESFLELAGELFGFLAELVYGSELPVAPPAAALPLNPASQR